MIDIMSLLMGICGPLFFFVEDSLTHPASAVETEELSRRLRSYGVSHIRGVTKHVHHHVSLRQMIHTKRYVKWLFLHSFSNGHLRSPTGRKMKDGPRLDVFVRTEWYSRKRKKRGERKIRVPSLPFCFFFLLCWVIYPLGHGTRFLCLDRVEITHL